MKVDDQIILATNIQPNDLKNKQKPVNNSLFVL